MRGRGRFAGTLAAIVAITVLAGAVPASAAEVIGQASPVIPSPCTDDKPFVQRGVVAGGPSYAASARGIITSWSVRADATPNRTFRLLVLRPDPASGASHFVTTAKDAVRTLGTASALNTFSGMRLPIEAGERIGLYAPDAQPGNQSACSFSTLNDADVLGSPGAFGEPVLGASLSYGDGEPDSRLNAAAVVEPDADCDGLGDETQDPAVDRKCVAQVLAARVRKGSLRLDVNCPLVGFRCEDQVALESARKIDLGGLAGAAKAKRVPLAAGSVSLAPGASESLTLKLTKKARRLFRQRRKVASEVTVSGAPGSSVDRLKVRRR